MVVLRTLTWPVAGVVTDRPTASLVTMALIVALGTAALILPWRGRRPIASRSANAGRPERWPAAWLVGTLAFSAVALAILAPSLAVVTPGLPNDHYHAFLDPVVVALVGAGTARLAQAAPAGAPDRPMSGARLLGPASAIALTALLAAVSVTAWPPAVSPDGGWRLADAAAAHIVDVVDAGWPPDEPRLLVSLPVFKPDDAMRFPLARRGLALQPPVETQTTGTSLPVGVVVVVCDPLFDDATGAPCGTLAEDGWLADAYPPSTMQLIERFRAGSRRIISIYAPSRLAAVG
jgi:hypothetical protein